MSKVSVGDALDRAWQLAKTSNGLKIALVFLGVYIIFGCFYIPVWNDMMEVAMRGGQPEPPVGVSIGISITGLLLSLGLIKLVMNQARYPEKNMSLRAAFGQSLSTYGRFIGATCLLGIAAVLMVMAAMCATVLPFGESVFTMILFAVLYILIVLITLRLVFSLYLVIDEPETSIIDCFKKSWAMTKGEVGTLVKVILASIGIYLVGMICCGIGVLFAAVIVYLCMVIVYDALREKYYAKNEAE